MQEITTPCLKRPLVRDREQVSGNSRTHHELLARLISSNTESINSHTREPPLKYFTVVQEDSPNISLEFHLIIIVLQNYRSVQFTQEWIVGEVQESVCMTTPLELLPSYGGFIRRNVFKRS